MVVLVTGSGGQLGQALRHVAPRYPQFKFHFADSANGDITNLEALHSLFNRIKPHYCINAAAYTAVDKAESEPEKARAINVLGAENLAKVCKASQCRLIHVSTDFVFDGKSDIPYLESDATAPQGVYGQTKREGEQAIAAVFDSYYIIRTSWVYSQYGSNFMKTMLRLAAEKSELNVVSDQIGTPTLADDLADALLQIVQKDQPAFGIYHFSNGGQTSWYGFARAIFEQNAVAIKVNPISTAAYPTPAQRPAYSVLDKSKISNTFGIQIRDWKTALKDT